MSERALVAAILRALAELEGCEALKYHGHPMGRRGHADVYGVVLGRAFYIEVKPPGGRVTPLQRAFLERMGRAGARVGVAHSVAEALSILGPT